MTEQPHRDVRLQEYTKYEDPRPEEHRIPQGYLPEKPRDTSLPQFTIGYGDDVVELDEAGQEVVPPPWDPRDPSYR